MVAGLVWTAKPWGSWLPGTLFPAVFLTKHPLETSMEWALKGLEISLGKALNHLRDLGLPILFLGQLAHSIRPHEHYLNALILSRAAADVDMDAAALRVRIKSEITSARVHNSQHRFLSMNVAVLGVAIDGGLHHIEPL